MRALLLVNLQVDFLPGGAMPIPDGDEVVAVANRLMKSFDVVVASVDWHPSNHCSFAANSPGRLMGDIVDIDGFAQVLRPMHCIADSPGAALAPGLRADRIAHVSHRGTNPRIDGCSAFFDQGHRLATDLGEWLTSRNIEDLYIAGLSTEHTVRATAIDACKMAYRTWVIRDACRAVDLHPGDNERALDDIREAGARIVTAEEVITGKDIDP